MELTYQLHRLSMEPVVLDFEPFRLKLSKLGNKFLFNIRPKRSSTSFNLFTTLASIKNLLLVFDPLVEATSGNTKLLARSVLAVAILVARIWSFFCFQWDRRLLVRTTGMVSQTCWLWEEPVSIAIARAVAIRSHLFTRVLNLYTITILKIRQTCIIYLLTCNNQQPNRDQKMELARLKNLCVKGHYVFKSESRPGDTFTCTREPGNPHSPDAIIVKLCDGSNVSHAPNPLARVLAPMLDGGVIKCMEGTVTGVARSCYVK